MISIAIRPFYSPEKLLRCHCFTCQFVHCFLNNTCTVLHLSPLHTHWQVLQQGPGSLPSNGSGFQLEANSLWWTLNTDVASRLFRKPGSQTVFLTLFSIQGLIGKSSEMLCQFFGRYTCAFFSHMLSPHKEFEVAFPLPFIFGWFLNKFS